MCNFGRGLLVGLMGHFDEQFCEFINSLEPLAHGELM